MLVEVFRLVCYLEVECKFDVIELMVLLLFEDIVVVVCVE